MAESRRSTNSLPMASLARRLGDQSLPIRATRAKSPSQSLSLEQAPQPKPSNWDNACGCTRRRDPGGQPGTLGEVIARAADRCGGWTSGDPG